MSGWFAMRRDLFRHPIFAGRPERVAVWVWLLATAAWKDTKQDAAGRIVEVRRGQILTSIRQISNATGVPVQPVRTVLKKLRTEQAIEIDVELGRTRITICNYDKYQRSSDRASTGANTAVTSDQHRKEQENNIPVGVEDPSPRYGPSKITTVTAALWDVGKRYLARNGIKDPGRLIGMWLKQSGGSASSVLAAIEAAQKAETQDPVPYISKIINGDARTDDDRNGAFAGAFGFIPEVG